MNKEIIAKDKNGVLRCYGVGKTHQQAMQNVLSASREYLDSRKDIESLFLYDGNTDKPIINCGMYEHWEVKL